MNENLSNSNELPVGWITTLLSEISEINMGQSPPSETYNNIGNGLPFFQGKTEFTELHPVVEKWCSRPNKIAETNDILLSVRAPVGTTNIANQRCCIGRGLAAIRYTPNHKFLFYYLRLIGKKLDEKGTGTTFKAISGEVLRKININVSPLPEQHAIVSKIEQLFSELDKGIDALKTAQQQLKVYRQSVLKWAFEGKLTEKWRKKNPQKSMRILFKDVNNSRIINYKMSCELAKANNNRKPKRPKNIDSKFKINEELLKSIGELPQSWAILHIAAITSDEPDSIVDGPFGSAINVNEDYIADGIPVVRINNILPFKYDNNNLKFVRPFKFNELKRHNIVGGDILFGKVGTIGNSCIYPTNEPEAMLATTGSCRIRVDEAIISKKFFCYYLNANKSIFNKIASAAVQAFLNMETINNFPVIIPSVQEQHQIVQETESRLSECDNMEATIAASLQQAEALRQSILKKAFEGKLLNEMELEAVRQDPTWEPAEKLLERTRTEKAMLQSGKKDRKGRARHE